MFCGIGYIGSQTRILTHKLILVVQFTKYKMTVTIKSEKQMITLE